MTGCPLLDSEYAARQNGKRLPCERLADENERLRELVRDMWRGCPVDERDCIACDFERDGMCDLFDRMRELGVDA